MLTKILQERLIIFLALFSILLKLFSLNPSWVENYYSTAFYYYFSPILRLITGWIPFSIGDLVYLGVIIWLILKVVKAIKIASNQSIKSLFSFNRVTRFLSILIAIYLIFQLFWGLNYDRQGIANQMQISEKPYSTRELTLLATAMKQKMNFYAALVDSVDRKSRHETSVLRDTAATVFNKLSKQHYFFRYDYPSIKLSLLSSIGHFVGFTGYYNPFTGEAQVSYTVPHFARPFIVSHEIAHQLGYAKENEASFVAYLACSRSSNVDFAYSIYFELYRNAVSELKGKISSEELQTFSHNLHPRVVADIEEWKEYIRKHRNFIEPLISKIYDGYLKLNNQPKGKETYNEVLVWLIAFLRKHGMQAL